MSDLEKFEAWAVQRGWPVGRGTVVYTNPTTERMWEAWQASRRSALEEAAEKCRSFMNGGNFSQAITRIDDNI